MISLCPLTVLPCSPLDQIEFAARAGFDAVGIRLVPVLPTDVDVMSDKALRIALAKRLADLAIGVLDIELVRIGPDTDVRALEPMLQFAGELGARSITVTGQAPREIGPSEEAMIVARLVDLCELAQRYDVKPGLEFMPFRDINNLNSALRYLELCNHPNLGVVLDLLHFCRCGGTPSDLVKLPPENVTSIQLCDAPADAPPDLAKEARYHRLLPGAGELPLRDILKALSPRIPLSVEVPNAAPADRPGQEKAVDAVNAVRELLRSIGRA